MSLVKIFKGVKICVNADGIFFCDVDKNSEFLKDATFNSQKITSIESAISNYQAEDDLEKKSFYVIELYRNLIKKIITTKHVGSRLFFDDGTDTSNFDRRNLYSGDIEKFDEFKTLESLVNEITENSKEAERLYKLNSVLHNKANLILKTFDKENVKIQ